MDIQNNQVNTIGIVGGGKVGLLLLEQFLQSSLTRVLYVVDVNPHAPAVELAKKNQVATFSDIVQAIKKFPVAYIFEVTGSDSVKQTIKQQITGTPTRMFTHEMSFVILSVIDENNKKNKAAFSKEILAVRDEIANSLNGIESLVKNINDIVDEMKILSINARIESARAGDAGKTFSVVAEQMNRSVFSIQQMTSEIEAVNQNVKSISQKIEISLQRLK
jgi:hypothetical protein